MADTAQYGVIIDAGSSGTRIYIYKWNFPSQAIKQASAEETHRLPVLKLMKSKKIHPGVSSFADKVDSVGYKHLESLIQVAIREVPAAKISGTPIFLMATAGVRFLPRLKQTVLLQGICDYLRASTDFHLPDCKSQIKVISGETEGLYGWITTNYLLGGFDHPEDHAHSKDHTYGFLDMGGASAQIAFAPNTTEAEKNANDLKLVRMRHLDGSAEVYKVFTATWLGFGANKARTRYVESLQDSYESSPGKDQEIPDPCMPRGLRTTLGGDVIVYKMAAPGQILVGTGAFDECLRKTFPLLRKDAPCQYRPCLLNGQHVPLIDFDVKHFVGVSEYWHATHGVFGEERRAYDIVTYQKAVLDFCGRDWSAIEIDLKKTRKKLKHRAQMAREACFKASWLINMLYDGIGIPRVPLESTPSTGINATREAMEKAKSKGYLNPFRPVDKIEGVEVSWTLGKMVLYAAGQVSPSELSASPVGFGSNVDSGTPPDFEHAGSVPLLQLVPNGKDNGPLFALSKPMSGVLALISLLLAMCLLRRPEWRRRILGMIRRQQRPGAGRKSARGVPSLVSKLFRRNSMVYDRIAEDTDFADLELGGIDYDDYECSDGSESSRIGPRPTVSTPKVNLDRSESLQPSSEMDRNGLVIRTESRERFTPTLQMLNAGRRSRGGSPTRLKSPLMTPHVET